MNTHPLSSLAKQVQFWNGRPQLRGQLTRSRSFSYALFRGALGATNAPYRVGGWEAASLQVSRRRG